LSQLIVLHVVKTEKNNNKKNLKVKKKWISVRSNVHKSREVVNAVIINKYMKLVVSFVSHRQKL